MGHASSHGVTAASLGSLNASHASAQAFAHASPHSVVGQLSAYAVALNKGDLSAAASALAQAANHSVTAAVVTTVNTNLTQAHVLSVSVSQSQAATIASMANAQR